MFTSTSPLELFRPMVTLFCRTKYSNSRPSRRAIGVPLFSGLHCTFEGLAGADLRAKRAQALLSWVRECADITYWWNGFQPMKIAVFTECLPTIQRNVGGHSHVTIAMQGSNMGHRTWRWSLTEDNNSNARQENNASLFVYELDLGLDSTMFSVPCLAVNDAQTPKGAFLRRPSDPRNRSDHADQTEGTDRGKWGEVCLHSAADDVIMNRD